MISRFFVFAVLVVTAACGGKSLDTSDGGGGGDGGPPPGPNCPASAPAQGGDCTIDGLECEYGSDVRSVCNMVATCNKGSWEYPLADDPTCPTGANPPSCPASAAQATGSCSDTGAVCNYSTSSSTSFCTCTFMGGPVLIDGGPSQYTWQCNIGNETGCPSARPKIGAACSQPGLECGYDVCGAPQGLTFQCSATTGTWVEGFPDACAQAN